MLETLLELDQSLSLAINQFHFSWLDPIMVFWSEKWVWIPLYALLLFLLWKNSDRNAFFLSLGMISVAIALSDQTASALLKPLFQRLRPCHQEALIPFLHLPKGCGGQFGFASSHSANCFCVFVLFERMLAKKMPAVRWLLFWALVTGWSRIYLGAHFLGDVLVGFVIGGFWAFISFTVLNRIYLLVKKSGIEKETP
jgi:undecaprenyl-diphosphatase